MFRYLVQVFLLAAAPALALAAPPLMRAVVVGDAGAVLEQRAVPIASAGEVLVKITAVAVHPIDWKLAAAHVKGSPIYLPGSDGAGIIEAVGDNVSGWKAGQHVFFRANGRGLYAEYATVPADAMVMKPARFSDAEAVSLATATTPWNTIVDQVNFKPGERFLIHAAAGGTGSAAVQLVKLHGGYVIGTASASNFAYVKSLGADEVIDYTRERFEDRVRDIDVVFNAADLDTANRSIAVLKRGGTLLSIVGLPDAEKCRAAEVVCATRPVSGGTPAVEILQQVAALAQGGKYKVNIDKRFALADFQAAWEYSRQGHTRGQVVLNP
jgi:NADPH:quinone reductase-like Zn-dependent oxidoreductase